jgi:hypothetical protein
MHLAARPLSLPQPEIGMAVAFREAGEPANGAGAESAARHDAVIAGPVPPGIFDRGGIICILL